MAELRGAYVKEGSNKLWEPREGDTFINQPDVSFDTISDLKGYNVNNAPRTKTANVLGYYTAGDGGGGGFYGLKYQAKANGTASIGSGVSLTVDALPEDLKSGQVLEFTGGGVFELTSGADKGDTTITGDLTVANVASDEEAGLEDNGGTVIELTSGGGAFRWKRLGSEFNFRQFGAKGNGTSDDTTFLQNALNSKEKIYGLDDDEYLISSTLTSDDDVYISCRGSFVIKPNSNFEAFSFENTKKVSTTLNADANAGDYSLTLTSVSDISEGDIIVAESDKLWYYDNRGNLYKGETSLISDVSGSVVNLKYSIYDSYDISAESVSIDIYSPKKILLENFTIDYESATNIFGAEIKNYYKPVIKNVSIKYSYQTGLYLYGCVDGLIEEYEAYKINADNSAYGIWLGGCLNCTIKNSKFYNCRAGVDFSSIGGYGPTRNCYVETSVFDGSGESISGDAYNTGWSAQRGVGTHGPAEYIYFLNNTIKNTSAALYSRGRNIVFKGNELINVSNLLANLVTGTNVTIEGNRTNDIDFPNKETPITSIEKPQGVKIASDYSINDGFTNIMNNTVSLFDYIVQIEGDTQNLHVKNNVANLSSFGSTNFINASGSRSLTFSSILNNTVYSIDGDSFNLIDSDITIDNTVDEDIVNRNRLSQILTIADDSVVQFQPKTTEGLLIVSGSGGNGPNTLNTVLHYRCENGFVKEVSSGSGTTVTSGSIPLTGISGSDGVFTIQVNTNGSISLENRIGGPVSFFITAIS